MRDGEPRQRFLTFKMLDRHLATVEAVYSKCELGEWDVVDNGNANRFVVDNLRKLLLLRK